MLTEITFLVQYVCFVAKLNLRLVDIWEQIGTIVNPLCSPH